MGDFKKNERDLKEELSPISYAVTQENATERPFSGKYDDFYEKRDLCRYCQWGAIV